MAAPPIKPPSKPPARPPNGSVRARNGAETIDMRDLLRALTALRRGDFSVRLPDDRTGLGGKIADTFNDVVEINQRMARELDRISRVVGKEGKIQQRAAIGDVTGAWATS